MTDSTTAPESTELPPASMRFRASFPAREMSFRTAAWMAPDETNVEESLHCRTTLEALLLASQEHVGVRFYDPAFDRSEDSMEFVYQSYADIYAGAGAMAAALKAEGIRKGDCVVLLMPTGFDFLHAIFAVQWIGAIPVPTYPPAAMEKVETGLERITHIVNDCGAVAIIAAQSIATVIGGVARKAKSLRHILIAESLDRHLPAPPQHDLGLDDPCFIQYTSGSTGLPKGVLLTHRNIVCNIHVTGMGYQISSRDSFVSWLPLYHDMGLIGGLFNPIYWRAPLALMSPMTFLMQPIRWLRMISENGATITAAPNFAYGLVAKRSSAEDRKKLNLSKWRIALSGAEPVNVRTVDDFCATFAECGFRAESLFPAYGLAECSLGVCFGTPGKRFSRVTVDRLALAAGKLEARTEGDEGAITLACVGKALPGHRIEIVDENGAPLDYGEVGHIVASGPSVMASYYKNPEATERVLQEGRLWTGDLGFLEREGLYVTGRAKDLIIVRGKNFYAEDIERCVELLPDVRPSGVVAFAIYDDDLAKDTVICVVETKLEEEGARAKLAEMVSESVSEAFGLPIQEVVLVEPGTIPRTSSGKRQRSLTRDRYLAGALEKQETSGLKLVGVFAKSAMGFLALQGRKLSQRRVPEHEQ
ncbi:MAG: fatty acyl-AMP ligase [Polyangiaceae bacterium]